MDPNAALEKVRQLVAGARELRDLHDGVSDDYDALGDLLALAEQVDALDEWLSKGGFLPSEWEKNRTVIWELNRKQVTDLVKNAIGRHQIRVAVDGGQFKYDGGTGWVAGIKPTKTVEQG